ncbi:hypothetical protein LCGC14_0138350 [marine sediment metagenome]|uniref:Uncharacterized protein n=1 Tax=marine sediment metagenome TaxID=412755 RepID=A0A0F9V2B8_9ZZZZ
MDEDPVFYEYFQWVNSHSYETTLAVSHYYFT